MNTRASSVWIRLLAVASGALWVLLGLGYIVFDVMLGGGSDVPPPSRGVLDVLLPTLVVAMGVVTVRWGCRGTRVRRSG